MNKTTIEWCARPGTLPRTWNPIRARVKEQGPHARGGTFCTRISPGCANCYASAINKRFGNGLEYTVPNLANVEFYLSEKILAEPLKQTKPCTIFVGDMFDLFHEAIPQEMIAEVLRVAWKTPRHTFQFLTKRADRMRVMVSGMLEKWGEPGEQPRANMWLGVSVESQKYADERIPLLLRTPAAIRFLSVEPQLETVDLREITWNDGEGRILLRPLTGYAEVLDSNSMDIISDEPENPRINWVICGGDSGPYSRPFNLFWAESLRDQCKAAGVAFFMKQLGGQPRDYREEIHVVRLKDRKGGDPQEWPEGLRVREFPA